MADLREELPYRTEYAKTGRAGCKTCKGNIAKDSIRMAVMVQSPFFDGKQPNWHHFDCFFTKYRPKLEEISHFASLKFEDQKRIEEAIEKSVGAPTAQATKGGSKKRATKKKKTEEDVPSGGNDCVDFDVEYAKSNRSKCRLCENTITKGTVRIGKIDRESEDARRFGPLFRWFHSECFISARESLGFYASAENIPHFDVLEADDKKDLTKKLKEMKRPDNGSDGLKAESPAKKPKLSKSDETALKKQSDLLFKYQKLAESMNRTDLVALMDSNKIEVPSDNSSKYERLAEAMAFGRLEKCPECKKGQLVFRGSGYICTGNVSKWSTCEYQTTDNPKRKPFKVPKDLAEMYDELKDYEFVATDRVFNPILKEAMAQKASTSAASSSGVLPKKESNGSKALLLDGYKIFSFGKLKTKKASLKSRLKKLGATLVDDMDRTTLCVISTKKDVDVEGVSVLVDSKELNVPIVSEEFLVGIENGSDPIQAISLNRLDNFEVDVEKRFNNLNVKEKMKTAFKSGAKSSGFDKSGGKQKMVLKDGNVVDPDCEVADVTHIYKDGDNVYNSVLSNVDLAKNKNSFYKLQLLKHDTKSNLYYVFRSWGRVGTTIGGTVLDKFKNKEDAISNFEDLFEEKTQNKWSHRKKFKKRANSYFPVDIDYGGDTQIDKLNAEDSKSALPKAVQDLICMIFDVEKMKAQMLEFELDLERMPLGKLSKKQLLKACSVLKELSKLIDLKPPNATKTKDATNRFYTLIPHNFGTERPPLIDSEEMIKTKMDMLEALLDIEMAYEMINSTDEKTKNMDPIDHHYHKLNANINPLSKEEEEFAIIEKYLKNTHGTTHNFSLQIEEAFKVERNGEAERYLEKYKEFDNRMLLWHGSRVTNFAGILSQGLRIAPPEAPVTGYMFGKGVYFADMVTKSAGYCYHHSNKNIGFLLLSEVAVGETWDLYDAKDVNKLPKGKHSVKGVGKTSPDPNEVHVMPNGVRVPLGKGVDLDGDKCGLLYNEYIVYDVNQVNIKYLLKCKFNTKSLF